MSQPRLKTYPALPYPADKLAVHFSWRAPALAPIKDELGSHGVDELKVHTTSSHDFKCIFTRFPVLIEGGWCRYLKGLMTVLFSAPGRQHVLSKLVVDIAVARFRNKSLHLGEGERPLDAVVQCQQGNEFIARSP